jgi:hypothetical protein
MAAPFVAPGTAFGNMIGTAAGYGAADMIANENLLVVHRILICKMLHIRLE